MNTWKGYKRADGTYGVRNLVAVISTADNSNFIARRVSQAVKGTIPLCPCFGRGEIGEDMEQHIRTMAGMGSNPNVHSAVVVSLEPVIAEKIAEKIRQTGKEAAVFSIDECRDTIRCVEQAVRAAEKMVIRASMEERTEAGMEHLILGVECGGSDTTSGIVSNPALGYVADRLVGLGGTVIMSETTEWMGAENNLLGRAVSEAVGEKIVKAVRWYEDYIQSIGVDLNGFNPAPDNIKGGLSTIEEKALGSIKKGGSKPIEDVLSYSLRPEGKGLYLMDAPTGGVENTTGLSAAGCQLILFSTGKGNPMGNPVAPTVKVTGNARTASPCAYNIDVDLSAVLTEERTAEWAGEELYAKMVQYANGKMTSSEVLDEVEIAVSRRGFTV